MALNYIKDYTTVPVENTDIDGINIKEGMSPSNVNDAIRELMADLAVYSFPLNVREYGAVGDGVTNDASAIQSALNAAVGGQRALYFPAGSYVVGSQITANTSAQKLRIYGDGVDATRILVSGGNSSGFLSITLTDRSSGVTIHDLAVLSQNSSGGGTAIAVTQPEGGLQNNRNVYIHRVDVRPGTSTTDYFTVGINVTGCWRPLLEGVTVSGAYSAAINADFTDSSLQYAMTTGIDVDGCQDPTLRDVAVYNASTAVSAISTEDTGPESFSLQNCRLKGNKISLDFQRREREPQVFITDTHILHRDNGISINGAALVVIKGLHAENKDTTPESTATPSDVDLDNIDQVIVANSLFSFAGNPSNRRNIFVDATTNADNVVIANNIFAGTAERAIHVGPGAANVLIMGCWYPGAITAEVDDDSGQAVRLDPIEGSSSIGAASYASGASRGPVIATDRWSPAPAINDLIGSLLYRSTNSSGNLFEAAELIVTLANVTIGSEDTRFSVKVREDGASVNAVSWDHGAEDEGKTSMLLRVNKNGTISLNRVVIDSNGFLKA